MVLTRNMSMSVRYLIYNYINDEIRAKFNRAIFANIEPDKKDSNKMCDGEKRTTSFIYQN